ncbi:949_t:CDS:2 [Funneliformis geosporum]|nr:949_t:CDS:2 [Funneliformis geosporum]
MFNYHISSFKESSSHVQFGIILAPVVTPALILPILAAVLP